MKEGMPETKLATEEASPVVSPVAEKIDASDMNQERWNRLDAVRTALLEGGGLHEMDNMERFGVISEEDLAATKRVLRAVNAALDKYHDAQHESANKDNEEIDRIQKRLKALQGSK
ncbi:MAG: hypothetical protein NUV90_03115 [Candidatus Parcubacteria bacterium]|nr:hypothetical protein [Candidatus Parcubacteria bacterium]